MANKKPGRKVICGANAYEQKYYFNNEEFGNLPESVKKELNIISVLFTEEVGGIFTIVIEEDGSVSMETQSDPSDFYYDDISSGLLINQIRQKRVDLFESLSMYYRVFFLGETFEGLEDVTSAVKPKTSKKAAAKKAPEKKNTTKKATTKKATGKK